MHDTTPSYPKVPCVQAPHYGVHELMPSGACLPTLPIGPGSNTDGQCIELPDFGADDKRCKISEPPFSAELGAKNDEDDEFILAEEKGVLYVKQPRGLDPDGKPAQIMPTAEVGYEPPKNWDGKKQRHPKTGNIGWPDKKGDIWVPTGPGDHGGRHWDVQDKQGKHRNVRPKKDKDNNGE